MGRKFRVWIYDYVERYDREEGGVMFVPGYWHLDVEMDPKTPRKIGRKLYEEVYTEVMTRSPAVEEHIEEGTLIHESAVVNPHFNDLGAAKRQVRAAIGRLARLHPKRWGVIRWDEAWYEAD